MKRLLCCLLPVLLASAAMVVRGADAEAKRPDLTGVVKSKDGKVLSGATAFIYTAGPKLGVGFL